jgi:hypothetical protein
LRRSSVTVAMQQTCRAVSDDFGCREVEILRAVVRKGPGMVFEAIEECIDMTGGVMSKSGTLQDTSMQHVGRRLHGSPDSRCLGDEDTKCRR